MSSGSVEGQFALARGKLPARDTKTKTDAGKRIVPVHPALVGALKEWRERGWAAFVGRAPDDGDALFPNAAGMPYREERAIQFQDDLAAAGCSVTENGHPLRPYSLRHFFATALT